MLQIKTEYGLYETVAHATGVVLMFSTGERHVIAEAFTMLIANQFDVPYGRRTLRIFSILAGIKALPSRDEFHKELDALIP